MSEAQQGTAWRGTRKRWNRAVGAAAVMLLGWAIPGRAQATGSAPGTQAGIQAGTQVGSQAGSTSGSGDVLQVPTTSSLFNPYYGSVKQAPARPEVLKLSLDDALRMGLENNLALVYARQSEQQQRAQKLTLLNVLLPNVDVTGSHAVHQFNLQAEGFRPGLLAVLGPLLGGGSGGGGATTSFAYIAKANVTQGQANLSQYLFNLAGYDVVRAYQHSEKAAQNTSNSARGMVVLNVGTAYLRAVAAQSQVADARALLKTDETVLYQSVEKHKAGITANLDELRSRVQYQSQQQTLISEENNLAKAVIALNREIGLAPEQQVELTEVAPYEGLEAMTMAEARRQALGNRQDYQALLEQLRTAEYERKAATHERLPTLIFNSNYGVTGVTGGLYHDTWSAVGTLSIPVFEEARFRGDLDTAEYQLENVRAQIGNLGSQIDQQLEDSMVDLRTAAELVRVSKSNVDLATTELGQSTDRFRAGVDDNLPVTQAESTLAQAQTQYVTSVYQLNTARLGLARNLGLIDLGYHPEIAGGRPAGLAGGSR